MQTALFAPAAPMIAPVHYTPAGGNFAAAIVNEAHTLIGVCPITGNAMYTHESEEHFHPLLSCCVFRPENHGLTKGGPVYFSTLCQFGGTLGDAALAYAQAQWASAAHAPEPLDVCPCGAIAGQLTATATGYATATAEGEPIEQLPTARRLYAVVYWDYAGPVARPDRDWYTTRQALIRALNRRATTGALVCLPV